jgi:hypothetical protein
MVRTRAVFMVGLGVVGSIWGCSQAQENQHEAVNPLSVPRDHDLPPVSTEASVLQHHKNGSRDGHYIDSALTTAAAANLHLDSTFTGAVEGHVYAQPLYVEDGPGSNEAFIVATESNHVSAIGANGATIWDKAYATPVTGNMPCGNVNPLGITGTPIIDAESRTIYFDAMTTPDNNVTHKHKIFAVSLDDGSVKAGWPVDVESSVAGFGSSHQSQRGALQLVNGILYVPYGGHFGDCNPYRGYVVGVPVDRKSPPRAWSTSAKRGGIWATGSLPTDGNFVYASTGNTGDTQVWGGGEAIIRLAAGPTFTNAPKDYYVPTDWLELDRRDADLGGANAVLIDMPGAPVPRLVSIFGKDANLYLTNRDDLGGMGGHLSKTKVANGSILGAATTYRTAQGTYIAFRGSPAGCPDGQRGNLGVLKILPENPPRPQMVWCGDQAGQGSPIVTTTDGSANAIVWVASDRLFGYDGDTGAPVYRGGDPVADKMATKAQYFNSPIAAKGRIAVGVNSHLYIYKP